MNNPILLEPIAGEDPCGADLRWDPQFVEIMQTFDAAKSESENTVVSGELAITDTATYKIVTNMVENISKKTKDLRLMAVYVESLWYEQELLGFANGLEDMVTMIEKWPDKDKGIYPRADEEDGDLGERNAPLGKLLNAIPSLVGVLGWGKECTNEEKIKISTILKGIFNKWTTRLEPAFGRDLPPRGDAWGALQKLVLQVQMEPQQSGIDDREAVGAGQVMMAATPVPVDAWDLIERATETMIQQDHHSPANPVLELLMSWRSLGITDIADSMKISGVSLEQLLESIKKQKQKRLNPK